MVKNCLVCSKKYFKTANESRKSWETRHKFCSRTCQSKWQETRRGWNKGLTVKDDPRIARFVEAGHRATRGKPSWNKGKSVRCNPAGEFKKGHIPWNKSIKGIHLSSKTEFKKGEHLNENHWAWKADKVNYFSLHSWVARYKGRPKRCERCNTTSNKRYEWANIDGKYRRSLNDYIRLCKSCHTKYDLSQYK